MAMYTEQVMKKHQVREHRNVNGKLMLFCGVSVISKDQHGEYEPPYSMSLLLKGKEATGYVESLPDGAYFKGMIKSYDYQTGDGADIVEYRKAHELLTAEEFKFPVKEQNNKPQNNGSRKNGNQSKGYQKKGYQRNGQ